MTQSRFRVDEVFDLRNRGGLVVCGTYVGAEPVGTPELIDEQTGHRIQVLGVDFPTARTLRTDQTILVVDRQDAQYATPGRIWTSSVGHAPLAELTSGELEDLVRRNDPYRGKAVYESIDRLTLKADGDAIGHLAAISRLPSVRSDRLFHGPSLAWAAIIGLLSAETEQSRAEAYAAFHDVAEDDQRACVSICTVAASRTHIRKPRSPEVFNHPIGREVSNRPWMRQHMAMMITARKIAEDTAQVRYQYGLTEEYDRVMTIDRSTGQLLDAPPNDQLVGKIYVKIKRKWQATGQFPHGAVYAS